MPGPLAYVPGPVPAPISARGCWILFLGTWMAMALVIRAHILELDHEVRREGLSNVAVVDCRAVLLDHLNIETGLRGHLVTGRREFLRPYYEGLGRVSADMEGLRSAVALLPGESETYLAIRHASDAVIREWGNQVTLSESEGIEAARKRFAACPTKPTMDKVRDLLTAIESDENARMVANMAVLGRSMATTIFLINAFACISALLLVALLLGLIDPTGHLDRDEPVTVPADSARAGPERRDDDG